MCLAYGRRWGTLLGLALGLLATPVVAQAQGLEVVGTRALGMAGAFVAVADDATAVYWNPAGTPRSGLLNVSVERQTFQSGAESATSLDDLQGGTSTFVGLTTPPLGLTYYRLRTARLVPRAPDSPLSGSVPTGPDLTERGAAASLVTHNLGATLVQSLGEYLDVAATIRYVRGVAGVAPRGPEFDGDGDAALERAADLPGHESSTVDLDLGALFVVGQIRAGVLVRNLREPSFDTPLEHVPLSLDRQVRAGVAWQARTGATMVACDVDLTESESAIGPKARHVAIGGEQWFGRRRLGARAGVRVNTADEAEPVGSAGVSVRVATALFVEGQITRGTSDRDRSWGLGLRFAY